MSKEIAWYVTKDNKVIRGTFATSWNKSYFIPNNYYNIEKFKIDKNDKNLFFSLSSALESIKPIENKNE